jgi:YD repeat-containing protein
MNKQSPKPLDDRAAQRDLTGVTHAYDAFGRHASMSDGVFLKQTGGTPGEAFTYDDDDNILTKTVNYSTSVALLEGLEISYGYNNDGSRAAMTVPTYESATEDTPGTFDYYYDDTGRMSNMTNPSGGSFIWTYDDNSWLASQTSKDAAGNTMVDATPGRREALPPPVPLRTVQDTFASHGSSISNAPRCWSGRGDLTQLSRV